MLDPGETKNEEGRTLYMNAELLNEMHKLQANRHVGCPYVFHRDGDPIKGFRKAGDKVCVKAGFFEALKNEDGTPVIVTDKTISSVTRI